VCRGLPGNIEIIAKLPASRNPAAVELDRFFRWLLARFENGVRSMNKQTPDAVEQEFFAALIAAETAELERILADDFILIDVMSGSEVAKAALLETIGGGQLRFKNIERVEFRVRFYTSTAVITGRTEMSGTFLDQAFRASSRYTHVFVEEDGRWRMVSAQGTPTTAPTNDP
jgi:ketosteroid isomerase-like protein